MRKIEPKPYVTPAVAAKVSTRPEVAALIEQANREYYYWDKLKHMPVPAGVHIKELWGAVKLRRKLTAATVTFGKYTFHWNNISQVQQYLHYLDMNIGGSLESERTITKEEKNRYLVSSIMEEAIASSQIEGAVTTRKRAKEMLRKEEKPRDKSEQMIFNNYVTIQKILELKDSPLDMGILLEVHRHITASTIHDDEEGYLRKAGDEINVVDHQTGRIVYSPPDEAELAALLSDLFAFFNKQDTHQFIHPLIKACVVHFMMGFIHPFTDGNGRTARALFYWYLIKEGYWLAEYLSISRLILKAKAQYARAFQYTEMDDNDLTYFILFSLRTTVAAFDELKKYIERKQEEKQELAALVGTEGITYKQALILEWFGKDPALLLTIKEAENRLAVSNENARKNLQQLAEKGFIETVRIDNKTKGYRRGKKFDKLRR